MSDENENVTTEESTEEVTQESAPEQKAKPVKNELDVFISYSTKNKNVADAVVANFEQHGIRCWYAPRDILPGQEWVGAIKEALHKAKVFVLIYTDESNASRQVMNEVALAFNANKTIVPFRLTEGNMNDELEYYLTRVHWLDAVSKPLERNIEALRNYVEVILDRPKTEKPVAATPAASEPTAPKAEEKKKSKVGLWIGIAVAAIALIVGGVFAAVKLSGPKKDDLMKAGYEALYFGLKGTDDLAKARENYEAAANKGVADAYYYLGQICEQEYDYEGAKEEYEKGIDAGSDLARLGMGSLWQNGLCGEADVKKAWDLYNEALDHGCVEADYYRAEIVFAGLVGQESSTTKAISLYKNVINDSKLSDFVCNSYISLGDIYRKGTIEVPVDLDAALAAYDKAYEALKCKSAQFIRGYRIAMVYDVMGEVVKADDHYRESFELCKDMAEAGSIYHMYWCGICYEYEMGTQQSDEEAKKWYGAANDAAKARNKRARCHQALYELGYLSKYDEDYEQAYEYFKEAADAGYGYAAQSIGDLYYFGYRGVDAEGNPDYQMAKQWFEKAIEHGCTDAYNGMGSIYSDGLIGEADPDKALEYYKHGAELGSGMSAYNVAVVYLRDGDYEEAFAWFRKAGDLLGYADAYWQIGDMYANGWVEGGNIDLAVEYYVKAVQEGCSRQYIAEIEELIVEAYYFGELFGYTLSSGADFDKAFYWAQKGAKEGSTYCMYVLGEMYFYGDGTVVDLQETLNWLTKSAEGGNVDAMDWLGLLLVEGDGGIPKNEKEGIKWLIAAGENGIQESLVDACNYSYSLEEYELAYTAHMKAAEAGIEDAVLYKRLAWMCKNGKGTTKDIKSAVEWYEKAYAAGATLGNDELFFVAYEFYKGENVQKSKEKAYPYFKAASEAGDGTSMYFLGNFYEYGINGFLLADPEQALLWYGRALDSGGLAASNVKGAKESIQRLVDNGQVSQEAAAKWLD